MSEERFHLPPLARAGHASHCKRCLSGLPGSQSEVDASKLALSFYCIGSLDLLGAMDATSQTDRQSWKDWIWEQQTKGRHGSGFRPSSFMTPRHELGSSETYTEYDTPHIIMTYTALLCLSILRDDFLKLDRVGIINFMRACQRDDGSFSIVPGSNETDLRTLYCAFAISHMLNDWSGVDTTRAAAFIASCRTYEGGYGQAPFCEAQGGTTYIAIASLHLAPQLQKPPLTLVERQSTIHWLLQNQDQSGGFCGRTGKDADACYCFWCGATLEILDAKHLVDVNSLVRFLASCQFKYGGISKAPGETPDPYHTYLSLAALSMYPPGQDVGHNEAASWKIEPIDPLLNATKETVKWARKHIPA